MKKTFVPLLAALAAIFFAGCVNTIDNRSRLSINPFGLDTIVARYKRPLAQVFQAAEEVLKFNGTLEHEDTIKKILEARVDKRTVWVSVDEEEPGVSRVKVQVLKSGGRADILWASEIDKQIALRLAHP